MVAPGDLNAKSSNWYNKDITSNESWKIEAVTSQNGLPQEINEPTHILNNISLCIERSFWDYQKVNTGLIKLQTPSPL